MNLLQIGLILKARWRIVLAAIAIGLLLSALWAFLSASIYQASAQVLVNVRAPDAVSMVPGDSGVTPQLQPDYLATQVDVIRSDRVAMEAARKLGMTQDPEALRQYREAGSPGSPALFFARQLQRGLRVLPSTESRVITINYATTNPEAAAISANAFANAYRDVSLALQTEPAREAAGFYVRSAADLRRRLADAQEALAKRRAELGVTGLAEQSDADDARLNALSEQLAAAQAAQATQGARTGSSALPDVMMSPVVQSLQSDIARLEGQRRQLATFAGPNNVDYQQITNQIASLRSELAKQRALVTQSAAASSAQAGQSVASLRGSLEAQRARVIGAQRARGEVAALQQDVDNLKQTYVQLVARQSQTNLLGNSSQTNISILSPATAPSAPSGLPWPLKIVIGMFLGTILGVGTAFLLEFLDQRMRTPEDATVWLGIPNLGGVRSIEAAPTRLIGSTKRYLPGPAEGQI
ncbi:MAG TPA: GNVR domain-containing protein [Sphingomonas sp.]|jgi:chain length determinant protein EpsF|uniref:GNVR domain-containing protein n=1 Tax=Sphingomonas sp. TaxID=28214 RepID=UPI002EDB8E4B